ncbi:MAG: hypothetical protein ACRCTQ_04060 [Brevinemataceae bacterium]
MEEIFDIVQNDFPYHKRWFYSSNANLFVWELKNSLEMFQFCFRDEDYEIICSWKKNSSPTINYVMQDRTHLKGTVGMQQSELVDEGSDYPLSQIFEKFKLSKMFLPQDVFESVAAVLNSIH